MAKLTFKRREKKFLLSRRQYKKLCARILDYGMVYDRYCRDGAVYKIYNIYFDDDENGVIRKSISHPKFKEKLRIRSYVVPETGDEDVFLEIKRKIKGVVVKRRVKLKYREAMELVTNGVRPESSDYIVNKVLDEIEYYLSLNDVHPAIVLSYERVAFFGADDPDFRVTFDTNIQTRRYDLDLSCGAYGEQLLNEDEVLMEIKITGAIPKWFSDILAEEKIYMSGFSKYGNEYSRRRGHEFLHLTDRKSSRIVNNQSVFSED